MSKPFRKVIYFVSSGAGVSVDAVRQHLIKTVPCLTDISKTAVSYLFCPPT